MNATHRCGRVRCNLPLRTLTTAAHRRGRWYPPLTVEDGDGSHGPLPQACPVPRASARLAPPRPEPSFAGRFRGRRAFGLPRHPMVGRRRPPFLLADEAATIGNAVHPPLFAQQRNGPPYGLARGPVRPHQRDLAGNLLPCGQFTALYPLPDFSSDMPIKRYSPARRSYFTWCADECSLPLPGVDQPLIAQHANRSACRRARDVEFPLDSRLADNHISRRVFGDDPRSDDLADLEIEISVALAIQHASRVSNGTATGRPIENQGL